MNELHKLLAALEKTVDELNAAPLLKKGPIGMKVAHQSRELTKKSFEVMESFDKRLKAIEDKINSL